MFEISRNFSPYHSWKRRLELQQYVTVLLNLRSRVDCQVLLVTPTHTIGNQVLLATKVAQHNLSRSKMMVALLVSLKGIPK